MPWRRFSAPIIEVEPSVLDVMVQRTLADRHDVVQRRTLLGAGASPSELAHALRSKRLHPIHSGVYARGRAELSWTGAVWAAIAACGPTSRLGGRAAAVRYGMLEPHATDGISLTAVSGAQPRGVDVRRVREPAPGLMLDGLPILTPHQVLMELASRCTLAELTRALTEAEINRLVDHDRLRDELVGRRRVKPLAELLAGGPRNTRSPAEDLVMPIVTGVGLPVPEVNVKVHGWWVDFLWRDARVALEVDSWTFHATASHYERDATKQDDLERAGIEVIRRTRKQLEREPMKVAARLARSLLGEAGRPPIPRT